MKTVILSPEEVVFQGDALSLLAPGVMGSFQILNCHAPIISILKEGEIILYVSEEKQKKSLHFAIKGGLLEVKENTVTILTD